MQSELLKGMVAGNKNHWPLKCVRQDRITAACLLLWNRMQAEGEQNNQYRNQKNRDRSCWGRTPPSPGTPPASDIFVNQQRLGRRCAAAHRVDPHRMVHHRTLLVGAAAC